MTGVQKTYPHHELTGKIIGAAMTVHRALKPGLDERIYENALCLKLSSLGIPFTQQDRFTVSYKGHVVGNLVTDLIVDHKVIVENKCVDSITDAHIAQTTGYLNITALEVGLILNFKTGSLTFKRIGNLHFHQNP